jgi:hypothetical protein
MPSTKRKRAELSVVAKRQKFANYDYRIFVFPETLPPIITHYIGIISAVVPGVSHIHKYD